MLAGAASAIILTTLALVVGLLVGAPVGGLVGGVLGLVLGSAFGWTLARAGSYTSTPKGVVLFLIDHTWSLTNTLAGSMFLLVNLIMGNELNAEDSRKSSSIVFNKGVIPSRKRVVVLHTVAGPQPTTIRSYFATTVGNVKVGVRPDSGVALKRHEDVHILQARLFGPLYLPLIGLGYLVAIVVPFWLLYHDHRARPIRSVRDYFMRGVYPHVWHEEWAYAVGGTPP